MIGLTLRPRYAVDIDSPTEESKTTTVDSPASPTGMALTRLLVLRGIEAESEDDSSAIEDDGTDFLTHYKLTRDN